MPVKPPELPEQYWLKFPDDLKRIVKLTRAEFLAFYVVQRDIQHAKHHGTISIRLVARSAEIAYKSAHAALESLVAQGMVVVDKKPGKLARYTLPYRWHTGKGKPGATEPDTESEPEPEPPKRRAKKPNRSPVGDQSEGVNRSPTGDQSARNSRANRSPVGDQNRSPVGDQHIESLEYTENHHHHFTEDHDGAVAGNCGAPLSENASLDGDDEKTRKPVYATPADELKALVLEHTGRQITQTLLDDISSKLGGDVTSGFIDELRTHTGNFTNYPGFIRKLASKRSRPASAPVTAEETYRCATCGSRERGVGLLYGADGCVKACACASPEYIARMTANDIITSLTTPEKPTLGAGFLKGG